MQGDRCPRLDPGNPGTQSSASWRQPKRDRIVTTWQTRHACRMPARQPENAAARIPAARSRQPEHGLVRIPAASMAYTMRQRRLFHSHRAFAVCACLLSNACLLACVSEKLRGHPPLLILAIFYIIHPANFFSKSHGRANVFTVR